MRSTTTFIWLCTELLFSPPRCWAARASGESLSLFWPTSRTCLELWAPPSSVCAWTWGGRAGSGSGSSSPVLPPPVWGWRRGSGGWPTCWRPGWDRPPKAVPRRSHVQSLNAWLLWPCNKSYALFEVHWFTVGIFLLPVRTSLRSHDGGPVWTSRGYGVWTTVKEHDEPHQSPYKDSGFGVCCLLPRIRAVQSSQNVLVEQVDKTMLRGLI